MDGHTPTQIHLDFQRSGRLFCITIRRQQGEKAGGGRLVEGESLKSYLTHFNNSTVRVDDPDQKFFVKAFQKGLRAGPFSDALALKKPVSMEEIRARVEKHVEMEEDQYERRKSKQRPDRKDVRHLAKAKEEKHPMLS
ncbi:hypothetical protein CR513_23991, partial [Mucuna pruriens]